MCLWCNPIFTKQTDLRNTSHGVKRAVDFRNMNSCLSRPLSYYPVIRMLCTFFWSGTAACVAAMLHDLLFLVYRVYHDMYETVCFPPSLHHILFLFLCFRHR